LVPFKGWVVRVANVGVRTLAASAVGLHKCSDAAFGARRFGLHQLNPKKIRSGAKKWRIFEPLVFFRMGKQPAHIGGKGAPDGAAFSPSRGKTCCLEINKVKRMGFKVFTFKQRSEDGVSERVRYVYASEKETVRCRRELLQRLREECTEIDLSAVIDDESVFGAELVNDLEVAKAVDPDDATSEADTASVEPPGEDYVMLVPPMPNEDDCDFMSSPPEPGDVPDSFLCDETSVEEEEFFDDLRDWVWDGCNTQQCV